MLQHFYNRIEGYYPIYDKKQLSYIVSIILFILINIFLQMFFFLYFYNAHIPEIYIINTSCISLFFIILYLIVFKYKIKLSCSLFVAILSIYIPYTTYILGYDKGSIVFLPVIVFAMYSIFPLNRLYLNKIAYFVVFSFILTLLVKIKTSSKYDNELMHIQYINLFIASILLSLIVALEVISEKFINKYSKKNMKELSKEVYQDYLTGLWNRRFLELEFSQSDKKYTSFIVIADIDYFKNINDSFGHNTGDYVLKKISDIFLSKVSERNIICRWGGEEFIFYFRNSNYKDTLNKIKKIKNTIENTDFTHGDKVFHLTISFGITAINHNISFLENIENADQALYYCKNNGRNMIATHNDKTNQI